MLYPSPARTRPRCCYDLLIVTLALLSRTSRAFTPSSHLVVKSKTALGLIPLAKLRDELTFFSPENKDRRCCIDEEGQFVPNTTTTNNNNNINTPFKLCLVEESDLPEVSLFIVKAFGADAIALSSSEFSSWERRLMEPAMDFFNGYAALSAFTEVLWGLRIRQADRVPLSSPLKNKQQQDKTGHDHHHGETPTVTNDISPPNLALLKTSQEKIDAANRKSLVLVLARENNDKDTTNSKSKWESIESNIDVIASVELRLQPCDAKIPFSLPWWDNIERRIAAFFGFPKDKSAKHLQPYLSALCVEETYRGQNIGRAMVRCLEDIAVTKWGYSKLYLHVDSDNTAALNLYKSEGYKDVGRRWNPFWAGKAVDIGYFYKKLRP